MPTLQAQKPKLHAARTRVFVKADTGTGELPTTIQVLRAGMWPEMSNKGMLYITPQDLQQMADNFHAGIGVPGGKEFGQLPIDFMHEEWAEAAGWITDLQLVGDALMASVTWTATGAEKLKGGEFKCFSPSFYPSCLGEWCDPEDWSITATNVLVGGALTNIPFFKDLQPIMASRDPQEGQRGETLFVEADSERSNMPTLDEVRVKDVSALTDEEKTLLDEHKDELSADEKTKFNIEVTAPAVAEGEPTVAETPEVKEALAVQASVKKGEKVIVEASAYKKMQDDVAEMKREKIKADVTTHLERGAIRSDQVDKWVAKIEADASSLELLTALPDNQVMAAANGQSANSNDEISATDELMTKARELVKAGETRDLGEATTRVLASNKELAARVETERKVN